MRVILKENRENLGKRGDIVNVAAGYGRNFLIPKKLAIEVTRHNVKMIKIQQQALKKKLEREILSYQEIIQKVNETKLAFRRKAGEKDVIFGSVSSSDIKEELDRLGFDIEKKKILLDEPLKRLGNFTVPIRIFQDERAELKVEILKEEEAEQEAKNKEKKVTPKEKKKGVSKEEKKESEEAKKE